MYTDLVVVDLIKDAAQAAEWTVQFPEPLSNISSMRVAAVTMKGINLDGNNDPLYPYYQMTFLGQDGYDMQTYSHEQALQSFPLWVCPQERSAQGYRS